MSRKGIKPVKNSKSQKDNNIWLISFVWLLRLLVLISLGIASYYSYELLQTWRNKQSNFPINSFALTSKVNYTKHTDLQRILVETSPKMDYFNLDIKSVEDNILALPWIHTVTVRKIWPNKLSISLLEYKPVAIWNNDYFLSRQGEVFTIPMDRLETDNLPLLFSPDTSVKMVLKSYYALDNILHKHGFKVKLVKINTRGACEIELIDGLILKLGKDDWQEKLDRFISMYPQIQPPLDKKVNYIDLRYRSGAAVEFIDIK